MIFYFLKNKIMQVFHLTIKMANRVEIPGYPKYFVYDDGRVYSEKENIFLRQYSSPGGSVSVTIRFPKDDQGKTKKNFLVHRLVYGCFTDESVLHDKKINIGHINGINNDNRLDNLKIMTASEIIKSKHKQNNSKKKIEKRVIQLTSEGDVIAEYDSALDAYAATGIHNSAISKVCLGTGYSKTAGGYRWEFADEPANPKVNMDELDMNEWRVNEKYPSHLFSIKGEIYNIKTRTVLHQNKEKKPKEYIRLHLNESGVKEPEYVHKLIAETFIPNPENKPYVNHKDGDKHNNCVDNLEWATAKENCQHACDTGLTPKPAGKAVIQIDINTGNDTARFDTLTQAAKAVGLKSGETIKLVCNGKRTKAGGYKWKWAD
jgi:hypothetical protein